MKPERQDYNGHQIELRARPAREGLSAQEAGTELLIDGDVVQYMQMPDGSYALSEYAYDPSDNLMDLSKRFIDYQNKGNNIRRKADPDKRT